MKWRTLGAHDGCAQDAFWGQTPPRRFRNPPRSNQPAIIGHIPHYKITEKLGGPKSQAGRNPGIKKTVSGFNQRSRAHHEGPKETAEVVEKVQLDLSERVFPDG